MSKFKGRSLKDIDFAGNYYFFKYATVTFVVELCEENKTRFPTTRLFYMFLSDSLPFDFKYV